jgi:hypothetical protein
MEKLKIILVECSSEAAYDICVCSLIVLENCTVAAFTEHNETLGSIGLASCERNCGGSLVGEVGGTKNNYSRVVSF